jgi:DNA-binding NarL/FixJ family response regulator
MIGPPVFLLAIAVVLAVASVAASLFALWRSQALVELVDARARAGLEQCEASTLELCQTVEGLAAQLRELPQQASGAAASPTPRSGLNLSKRSQVLRLHRKGEPPDQIAQALEVPRQEVDLLIKVHRIVIGNL